MRLPYAVTQWGTDMPPCRAWINPPRGSQNRNSLLRLSAWSRLQILFSSLFCDWPWLALNSIIHNLEQLLFSTYPTFLTVSAPGHSVQFSHTYAEYINFAGAAAAWLFQLWLFKNPCCSVWTTLVCCFFLLEKLIQWFTCSLLASC